MNELYYNLSNYDTSGGYGIITKKHPTLGVTSGMERPMNTGIDYTKDVDDDLKSKIDDENFKFIDHLKNLNKINNSLPQPTKDFGSGRQDKFTLTKNTTGILEYSKHHKNFARKGISPYPQQKFSGPALGAGNADQAFKTTGNYRRIGTQYGSSRPHKILTDIEDNNIFNLSDIDDPIVRSFRRQQNRVKKVLSLIKEYVLQ